MYDTVCVSVILCVCFCDTLCVTLCVCDTVCMCERVPIYVRMGVGSWVVLISALFDRTCEDESEFVCVSMFLCVGLMK